jgi:hypothetical protein
MTGAVGLLLRLKAANIISIRITTIAAMIINVVIEINVPEEAEEDEAKVNTLTPSDA